MPDVTVCRLNDKGKCRTYAELYRTTRHELAHASHFSQVGPVFWTDYVDYIVTYGRDGDSPYGSDGHGKNSGVCAVGEMWGYAIENLVHYERYGEVYQNGFQRYWFEPEILFTLMTNNILTPKQVFVCLTSDVRHSNALMSKLIRTYPKKAKQITAIFAAYNQ